MKRWGKNKINDEEGNLTFTYSNTETGFVHIWMRGGMGIVGYKIWQLCLFIKLFVRYFRQIN